MASVDVDETTNCPVCYEGYEEIGDHVPRILPCHHSVCEKCVEELLRGYTFTCPECRKKHHALRDKKSFPQNKYIVSLLRKTGETSRVGNFDACEIHHREISLFCNEAGCKKAVCSLCLISGHKNHDVKDLQEINQNKSETIMKNVKNLMQNLESRKETFLITKEELDKMTKECVAKIREKKEEHMRIFDSLIRETTEHKKEVKKKIEQGITSIDESLVLLDNVKESVRTSTYNGLVRNQDAFELISENVSQQLAAVGTSKYPKYTANTRDDVCGKMMLSKFEPYKLKAGGK